MREEAIENLIRNENYLHELYEIKEQINIGSSNGLNAEKFFGNTRDKCLNVIIFRQELPNSFFNNEMIIERIFQMTRLIEENTILVENIWIEETFSENDESSSFK
jgi:hypothetical protein